MSSADVVSRHSERIRPLWDSLGISDVQIKPNATIAKIMGKWVDQPDFSYTETGLRDFVNAICSYCNRQIHGQSKLTCYLPTGERVQIITSQGSPTGIVLNIRIESGILLTLQDYAKAGAFANTKLELQSIGKSETLVGLAKSGCWLEFFQQAIQASLPIGVIGVSGAGKTKFMRALIDQIPEMEMIAVAEEVPELRLKRSRSIEMCVSKEMTVDQCVECAVRMACDRFIYGEVVDGAAYSLMNASLAIPGQIFTFHASSVFDAPNRWAMLARQHPSGNSYAFGDLVKLAEDGLQIVAHIEAVVRDGDVVREVTNVLFRGR